MIDFLAKTLGIPKSRLSLVSGQASRSKRVVIAGVSIEQVERALVFNSNP